jgi:selenide,water dikinase
MSNNQEPIQLTHYAKASGCGCKIQPAVLHSMLDGIRSAPNGNLILGNSTGDDCSVYDLGNGQYLLQTVDFFTPLVNDPFIFGKAAATNALSDIWAMGGKPIMANAILGWPVDTLSVSIAKGVLQGGVEACIEAGIAMSGGHSIDSPEPIFGLSVTGLVNAENLKTNAGARVGDYLYLTKPLGIGMLAAAHKRSISTADQDTALFSWITRSNAVGSALSKISGVHAITDITGFGLLGHALEMCEASGVFMEILGANLPKIDAAKDLAQQFVLPDNAMRNWNSYQDKVDLLDQDTFAWIVDPQTSGGLLISVQPNSVDDFLKTCQENNTNTWQIGVVTGAVDKENQMIGGSTNTLAKQIVIK